MAIWVHPEEAEEAVEFLGKVECWSELEKIVKSENKSRGIIHGFELLCYYGAMYGATAAKQEQKCKIPGTLVKKEGINYCIHGLMHIEERTSYVWRHFRKMDNIVCETNIKKLFRLPNLVDQPRRDECKYAPLADSAMSFGSVYGITLISWALGKLKSKESREYDRMERAVMVAEDERLIMIIGDVPVFVSDIRLPERLEHGYIQSSLDNHFFNRFCTLRSLSQTEFLENFAKSRGLKEAHGIYGLVHEPEIAYFLRYPQKAEEIKERYRRRPLVNEIPIIGEIPFIGKIPFFGK